MTLEAIVPTRSAPLGELAREAFDNLLALRQRSALALLGIVIGTASVVAMLSIGHMAEREAVKLFEALGVDMLTVRMTTPTGEVYPLDRREIESLVRAGSGVNAATAFAVGQMPAQDHGADYSLTVMAAAPALADLASLKLRSGRPLVEADADSLAMVIGSGLAAKLSRPGEPMELGHRMRVGQYLFEVVGILAPRPRAPLDAGDYNDAVIVPFDSGSRTLGAATANTALLRVSPTADVETVKTRVTARLSAAHPGLNVMVQSASEIIKTAQAQKTVHTRLLAATGGISLLVGGVGVMNVMLMGVMERRREIGLRTAIGATPRDIQIMFLAEALVLALCGGVVGAGVGVIAAFIAALVSHWSFSVALYALPLGAGVATAVGLLFGIYPAIKASRLDPIEALRA
ncbi:MAG: ABC transporter permease [Phenylobacterium sp.]|uniref:ABC transporter permease n=1 Tax=Phenylobacterium sp. TaxID=1871053 RepID=UPI0025F5390F|nr:ABC transporter permease [Phenylobacterium sp.]MCA6244206.1 ABC transporter permease [Phenylobacterium sp.]